MPYKHDYDKALTRLVTILTKLYNGETLVVKDLATEFNVSTRTIQRDLNERLTAFPIYQENRVWKMADDFKIEKSLGVEDSIILDIIDKMSASIGGDFYKKAQKLLSKIKNEDFSPLYAKIDIEDISEHLREVHLLETAIKDKKVIECSYSSEDKTTKANIKPLKIANFQGFWYLISLDAKTDILKKYYLKNVFDIKVSDTTFTVDRKIEDLMKNSISIWFQKDYEPFEVKISISNTIAKYIKRKPIAPTQKIVCEYEDGSLDIELTVTHQMEIIPIVQYWLPNMKIISPKWIDKMICDDLKNYLKRK